MYLHGNVYYLISKVFDLPLLLLMCLLQTLLLLIVNQTFCVCVSSLTIAPAEVKVPPNTQPRFLQEEGFYVGIRPYVSSHNLNRMENRLLKEAGGGYVTRDEEASIGDLKNDSVRDQWNCYSLTVLYK